MNELYDYITRFCPKEISEFLAWSKVIVFKLIPVQRLPKILLDFKYSRDSNTCITDKLRINYKISIDYEMKIYY